MPPPGSHAIRSRSALRRARIAACLAACLAAAIGVAACEEAAVPATPLPVPGTSDQPRIVNIIGREYGFVPPIVDLVPGETVAIRFVNGGLEIHEIVIGGLEVQDAWERAEAATVGHPPGPTPAVSVPPEVAGLRVVAASGQRADVTWTVPAEAPEDASGWYVGCHIPGHWAKGMVVPVRFIGPDGEPIADPPAVPSPVAG